MANSLIHRGSVKDIYQHGENLRFVFSDRYSLFDWGEMPDSIENKGKALTFISEVFFQQLSKIGIKHHFLQADENSIQVKKFKVQKPKWIDERYDYSWYQNNKPTHALIPLEVIFRFDIHPQSSLKDRILKDPFLLKQWGLENLQSVMSEVIVDFSTKLEKSDRYLTFEEAQKISGMSHPEFLDLMSKTKLIANKIYEITTSLGLKLWDGKLEFAFGDLINGVRELILVDSIGLDEIRIEYNGLSLSKEYLREYYRHSDWYYHLQLLKKNTPQSNIDYKKNCIIKPLKLPPNILNVATTLYQSFANELALKFQMKLPFDPKMNLTKLKLLLDQSKEKSKRIVILGKGAREAALALKLCHSENVESIMVIPGNPMMPKLNHKISINDNMDLNFIRLMNPDLVIIGPEDLLEMGVVDYFKSYHITVVGPTREAANLELSKLFCKEIFNRAGVLTARYQVAKNFDEAAHYISSWNMTTKFVLKVDEICQGKGVIICQDKSEGIKIAKSLFDGSYLGKTVQKILIEECLPGPEASVFAITDGESFKFLGSATDYKKLKDGDLGPNTGGMGAVSPSPVLDEHDLTIIKEIYFPNIIREMKKAGIPYQGFLFLGLLKSTQGLYALEVNARLGDPETQVILPLIENDLLEYFFASTQNDKLLNLPDITFRNLSAAHVVMSSAGYPGIQGEKIKIGEEVKFIPLTPGSYFFPASVSFNSIKNTYVTAGGRVLGVTALSENLKDAVLLCYKNIQKLEFSNAYYRKDIGRSFYDN